MNTMIKEPSIETLVKELINGLSVRAIKGHAKSFKEQLMHLLMHLKQTEKNFYF